MNFPFLGNQDQELFMRDLQNGWSESVNSEWTNTIEHSNELYDLHGVGTVKNVLCLRLFASSLFEIANSTKDARKMMTTIFGDLRGIAEHDMQVYESIEQTMQHLCWRLRKSQILLFRRTRETHGWSSVREILIKILCDEDSDTASFKEVVAGMSATILQDIFRSHTSKSCFREDAALLPKSRFHQIFRVSLLLFNDSIVDYIQNAKNEVIYEMLASRLVYFYTRLAADTWRILVVRNGPKVETEWYMLRSCDKLQDTFSSPQNQNDTPSTFNHRNHYQKRTNTPYYRYQLPKLEETVSHDNLLNTLFANQRPLRKY